MTDRFNLSFTNGEHDLFVWLQSQQNPSGLIKDYLKAKRNGEISDSITQEENKPDNSVLISSLLRSFIGDDVDAYGGEAVFLDNIDTQILNTRVSLLVAAHPNEADAVISLAKERYPVVGAKL